MWALLQLRCSVYVAVSKGKYSMAKGMRPLRGELLLPNSVNRMSPPDYLSAHAREYWGDLVRALGPSGMLSEVDGPALAMLCENLSDYWSMRAELEDVLSDPSSQLLKKVDLILLRAKVSDALGRIDSRVRDWLSEMCLTPMSRSKAQPVRAELEEEKLDLSALDADERQSLREMLAKRGEQKVLQ